jgi:hypothetical protein
MMTRREFAGAAYAGPSAGTSPTRGTFGEFGRSIEMGEPIIWNEVPHEGNHSRRRFRNEACTR